VKNLQVSQRTKHIDIRQHFVRELQRQKRVIGEYVRSENNMADSGTKNLAEKVYARHVAKLKNGENLIRQREDVSNNVTQDPEDGE